MKKIIPCDMKDCKWWREYDFLEKRGFEENDSIHMEIRKKETNLLYCKCCIYFLWSRLYEEKE